MFTFYSLFVKPLPFFTRIQIHKRSALKGKSQALVFITDGEFLETLFADSPVHLYFNHIGHIGGYAIRLEIFLTQISATLKIIIKIYEIFVHFLLWVIFV